MLQKLIFFIIMFFSFSTYAQTTYVYNVSKNEVVVEKESGLIRPIASVTKLMTAIVIIDSGVPLDEKVQAKGILFFKSQATREELLKLTLVKSDNYAAEELASSFPGGRTEFINVMNRKAAFLGMQNTTFFDPTGLSSKNTSTARDLTVLLSYAYGVEKMKTLSSIVSYTIEVPSKKKTQVYGIHNTNYRIMESFNDLIVISKTGTTNAAGKCLALFVLKGEEKYALVFLGYKDRKQIEEETKQIISKLI